jgi:thiol-disulfide isomerase/thioredoxin
MIDKSLKFIIKTNKGGSLTKGWQSFKCKEQSDTFRFSLPKAIGALLFLLLSFHAHAQDSIIVKGQFIGNTKYAKVLMKKFDIGSFLVAGAAIKGESFALALPPDIPPGVYRFQYAIGEGEQYLDLVINGKEKEISFTMQANKPGNLPVFQASEENKKWYEYLKETNSLLERISLLNDFIYAYPKGSAKVLAAALQEWEEEKQSYKLNFELFKKEMQGTWAYEMVVNRPYYFTNPKDDPRLQDFEKREHFWDGFDANNPKLINTSLYTEHILNYLRYWMNPNMNFSEEEKTAGFKRAVDVVIRKFAGNEQTHSFAYKYLTLGFKEIGEEEVLQYLDENYKVLAEQCFDAFEKTEFEKRMTGYAAMKEGNMAPDFDINIVSPSALNVDFKVKSLYKIKSEKTLIVFWSSSCPHCMEEMPKLNEWATKQMNLQVIAVSLDTDKDLFAQTIKQFQNMLHTCDYKGWDTEAAIKYFIAATPTFILLDKDKNILGKYSKWESLK